MADVIVIQFITIDGIVEDPDGSKGTPRGGWGFRFGPEAIAGDKFGLGSRLDTGVLLFGHRTWQLFSRLWPSRTTEFADAMNRSAKVVVSHSQQDLAAWGNSTQLEGGLLDGVTQLAAQRDVVVIGSTSVVHALMDADLVDEYRLLVFPTALGDGERLFTSRVDLELARADSAGPMMLMTYRRGG
jgi:dihydrofolate reductase